MERCKRFSHKWLQLAMTLLLSSNAMAQSSQDQYPVQDTARAQYMEKAVKEHPRMQVPTPPYNYTVEDVTFTDAGTTLTYGATFTRPKGLASFPTVVLISGTSPSDRDYTGDGHKFFWVLADYLSNHGIAVLRIDDRGTAQTNGIYFTATTMDFAKDILAGVTYLHTRKDVDTARIGLVGHSEGGIIAPMTHNLAPGATKFTVLISPPIVGLRVINDYQSRAAFKRMYKDSDTLLAGRMRLHHYVVDNIPARAPTYDSLQKLLAWAVDTFYHTEDTALSRKLQVTPDAKGVETLNRSYKTFAKPWWLFILDYQPVTDIRKLQCPVLAIFGTKDTQVPPQPDYDLLKANLPANTYSEMLMIKDMNHFMQPDPGNGSYENYKQIPVTIMPEVLDKVATWINKLPSH